VAEIELDDNGFAYMPIYAKHNDNPKMTMLSFKVDSGANRTTVSHDWLNALGYDDNWIKTGLLMEGDERPSVATGQRVNDCYRVALPEINIGGDVVGYNWPILVSLDEKLQFRLLFGTDSMQFFNWEFQYGCGVCKYVLILGKRQVAFDQKEQSIHTIDELADK
jgi:hypothetical protein